ncbi:UNVERIFIED_CONTAM: IQ calmodulin-binding motif domain-containing protein [Hammondia hammondi]|eukprot:XP_008884220.1 IQ calmodulin-binding motif domain-containing protein [Hammondia hammondi]
MQDRRDAWMRAHRRWMAEETLKQQQEAFFGAPTSPRHTANPASSPHMSPRASSSLCRRPHSSNPAAETRDDLRPAACRRLRPTSVHAGFLEEASRAGCTPPFSVEEEQRRVARARCPHFPFSVYQAGEDGQPHAARAPTRLEMHSRSRSAGLEACSSGEYVLTHLKSSTLTVRECKQLRREFAFHVHSENGANSEDEAVGSPRLPHIVRSSSSPRRRSVEASHARELAGTAEVEKAFRGREGGRDSGTEDERVKFPSSLSTDFLKHRRVNTSHGRETSETAARVRSSSAQRFSPSREGKPVRAPFPWMQHYRELCEAVTDASDSQVSIPLSESRKDLTCRKAAVSLSRRPVNERDLQLQTLLLQLRQAIREDEKRAARRERKEDIDVCSLRLRGGTPGENCDDSPHRLLLRRSPGGRLSLPGARREDEKTREEGEKEDEGQTREEGEKGDEGQTREEGERGEEGQTREEREKREEGNATSIYGQEKARPGDRGSKAAPDLERKMKERREKTRKELAAFCACRGLRECQHPHHHPEIPFLHPLAALCDAAVKLQRWVRRIYHLRACRAKLAALWRRRQFEKLLSTTKAALLQWLRHPMLTPQDEAAMLLNREHAERLRELSARMSRATASGGRAGKGKALMLPRVETRRLLVRLPFTCRSHSFATRADVEKQQKQLHDTLQHIALLRRQQQQTARSRKLWNRWKCEHDRAALGVPPESASDAGGVAISPRAAPGEAGNNLEELSTREMAPLQGVAGRFPATLFPAPFSSPASPSRGVPLLGPAGGPVAFLPTNAEIERQERHDAKMLRFLERASAGEEDTERSDSPLSSTREKLEWREGRANDPLELRERSGETREGTPDRFSQEANSRRSISASSSRKQIRQHWLGLGGEDVSAKVDEVEFLLQASPLGRRRLAAAPTYSPWLHLTLGLKHPNFHRYGPRPPVDIPGFAPPSVCAAFAGRGGSRQGPASLLEEKAQVFSIADIFTNSLLRLLRATSQHGQV